MGEGTVERRVTPSRKQGEMGMVWGKEQKVNIRKHLYKAVL